MDIHIFSTDPTCFDLADLLPEDDRVTCVVVPSNRKGSEKVQRLTALAESKKIPVNEHALRSALDKALPPAQAAISWLYSQIILVQDLRRYSRGILNMHGGAIPEYRGASVLHWAIINGESEMGITWHELIEEVDAGPIWAKSKIPIPDDSSAADMRQEMIKEGVRLFPGAWNGFKDKTGNPVYPDLTRGKVWPQRKPKDGLIGEGWSERKVRDLVRALYPPWPPAFLETQNGPVYIKRVLGHPEPSAIPYQTSESTVLYLLPA
ncbi:MAG: formyltransferase family protein [Thermodesulfobacteriota bacterium]|nr:formyltransferase family protein [Thermodesulfobacteriota bacterium]